MSYLSYRCPKTSQEVKTGIETDPVALTKIGNLRVGVACPHCEEKGHIITADSMFFSLKLTTSTLP